MNSLSKKQKLLLVDDDAIFVEIAKRTIEKTGAVESLKVFPDGEGAISFLKEHKSEPDIIPDFIFLDINMPFMDGWQFLEEYANFVNALSKKPEIYMVSSSVDDSDLRRAKEIPLVKDYIIKPVSLDSFKKILTNGH
ncbi:response regulator [Leptospira licerasiae]|uniref:Response regulator receiver domain protein n=1 Tax=Leptospira licerasiae str. MMD4847 TaxID=1049971 RepID=A0ABN0H4Z1_9LEPT|nr:response regulator [Leptospira licerasiae]EIE01936.1 response regulator receiver domain protein [Leptospira licerasiae serovar Varillal str. VAR 010]EJZ40680.1 response regulator receiver domain protein [Leptospira licerasiae str. MMD4847]TGM90418.1 response regulator [Leptospira licerasiae]